MILLFALLAGNGEPGWAETYLNYPGLEAWKFINLAIFLAAGIFIVGKKLKSALAARREGIQQLLANADRERDAAQIRLTEAETLVARVDDDVAAIHERAKAEAQMERERLAEATEKAIEKMRLKRGGRSTRLEKPRGESCRNSSRTAVSSLRASRFAHRSDRKTMRA